MKKIILLVILFPLFLYAKFVDFSINPVKINFSKGSKKVQYVIVKSRSSKRGYVALDVFNPAKPKDKQTQKKTLSKKFGLIVSPRRLILAPHQAKRVRIVNLIKNPKSDKGYDLEFYPVDGAVFKSMGKDSALGVSMKVRFIKLVRVFVRSHSPKNDIVVKRHANEVIFTQKGNVISRVSSIVSCDIKDVCKNLYSFYLYPKKPHMFKLPKNASSKLDYRVTVNGEVEDHSVELK